MRTVYVAGWMRSGTTLLGDVLGAQPGAFNAGEVSGIWFDASRGGVCSCGDPLMRCSVWGAAIEEVSADLSLGHTDISRLATLTARHLRTRNWRALMDRRGETFTFGTDGVADVVDATTRLLNAALGRMGAEILIDTSKLVPGLLFHVLAGSSVSVAHIFRDPRAVSASALRTAGSAPGNASFEPPGESIPKTLLHWYGANASIALACRALKLQRGNLSYEDLVRYPAPTISRLARDIRVPWDPGTIQGSQVSVDTSHVAVGNPARFGSGLRELTLDERWRSELGRGRTLAVEVACAPAQLAYRWDRRRS